MTAARSIAAVLIVRDEARCLRRCLDSVRPWVDRLVVVDTGSTDDSPAIAAACGAAVHHLRWPDDFARARNHALALADADWNLILDADESIVAGGAAIRPWCDGPPRLGQVRIHSRYDAPAAGFSGAGDATSRSWITRLIPRGVRFAGHVHEQVVSTLPRAQVAVEIDHDGYLDAQLARKRGRNHPLLLRDLAAHPDDPYLLYQLGKDAGGRGDDATAVDAFARAAAGAPAGAAWRHDLIVSHLQALRRQGALAAALALAEDAMATWYESPDFFFEVGCLALDRAAETPARALDTWLPLAVSAWERCLAIGERPDLEGSVRGRGSDLAQHNLSVLRGQLAAMGA